MNTPKLQQLQNVYEQSIRKSIFRQDATKRLNLRLEDNEF